MPRILTASGLAEAARPTTYYTELFDVQFPDAEHLHLTPTLPTAASGISFSVGDLTYKAAGIGRSAIKSSSQNEVSAVTVRFVNVDQSFGALVENLELRGAPVTISGAFINAETHQIDEDNIFEVYRGNIGAIRVTETDVNVDLDYAIKDIQVTAPRRFYGRSDGFFWGPPTS